MAALAEQERFEEAGVHRDRLAVVRRAAARTQRLTLAHPVPRGRGRPPRRTTAAWSVHVVRHGRLAAAGRDPQRRRRPGVRRAARASAETVVPSARAVPAATAEESERILRWLELPGIRLVEIEGEWTCPVPARAARSSSTRTCAIWAMITAIVFVKADVARIPEVAEAIAALDGVSEVYSVTGQIDLIALVRVRDHEEVATVVADQLNKVPGVVAPRPTSRSAPTPGTTSSRRSPSAWTEGGRPHRVTLAVGALVFLTVV